MGNFMKQKTGPTIYKKVSDLEIVPLKAITMPLIGQEINKQCEGREKPKRGRKSKNKGFPINMVESEKIEYEKDILLAPTETMQMLNACIGNEEDNVSFNLPKIEQENEIVFLRGLNELKIILHRGENKQGLKIQFMLNGEVIAPVYFSGKATAIPYWKMLKDMLK